MLASGGRAVTVEEAVKDADVIILSIPLNRISGIALLLATVPADTVMIDTSNYYPMRDDKIAEIEVGKIDGVVRFAHSFGRSTDTCDFPKAGIAYGVAECQPITSASMFESQPSAKSADSAL